jgi:hypothetical protein
MELTGGRRSATTDDVDAAADSLEEGSRSWLRRQLLTVVQRWAKA